MATTIIPLASPSDSKDLIVPETLVNVPGSPTMPLGREEILAKVIAQRNIPLLSPSITEYMIIVDTLTNVAVLPTIPLANEIIM